MSQVDEGLIHAWIEGQLAPDEAARVERLVETDAEWSAAAAEARGLIAATARITRALDGVPRVGSMPAADAPRERAMRASERVSSKAKPGTGKTRSWTRARWIGIAASVVMVVSVGLLLDRNRTVAPAFETRTSERAADTAPLSPPPPVVTEVSPRAAERGSGFAAASSSPPAARETARVLSLPPAERREVTSELARGVARGARAVPDTGAAAAVLALPERSVTMRKALAAAREPGSALGQARADSLEMTCWALAPSARAEESRDVVSRAAALPALLRFVPRVVVQVDAQASGVSRPLAPPAAAGAAAALRSDRLPVREATASVVDDSTFATTWQGPDGVSTELKFRVYGDSLRGVATTPGSADGANGAVVAGRVACPR